MASNRRVMVLPGDGIGNEVMAANMKLIDWLAKHRSLGFDLSEGLVGGAAYDVHGVPLTEETLADSMASDAVLFGAVGTPKYDGVPFDVRPEAGLLRLRKEMDLFANLRPAMVFSGQSGRALYRSQIAAPSPALRQLSLFRWPDARRRGQTPQYQAANWCRAGLPHVPIHRPLHQSP